MKEEHRLRLLAIDSIINVVLGGCLLFWPGATISFFGLPTTESYFYVTVLGAVLLGIGIALWIERRNDDRWRGLGLVGAIIINILGAGTVLVWLLSQHTDTPFWGQWPWLCWEPGWWKLWQYLATVRRRVDDLKVAQ